MSRLEIKFDLAPLQQRLDEMTEKIERLGSSDMPAGLLQWQKDDMKRRYPNMEQPNNTTAATRIWPTSRLNLKKQRQRRRVTRPILRPVLVEQLCERMDNLLEEKLTWR